MTPLAPGHQMRGRCREKQSSQGARVLLPNSRVTVAVAEDSGSWWEPSLLKEMSPSSRVRGIFLHPEGVPKSKCKIKRIENKTVLHPHKLSTVPPWNIPGKARVSHFARGAASTVNSGPYQSRFFGLSGLRMGILLKNVASKWCYLLVVWGIMRGIVKPL